MRSFTRSLAVTLGFVSVLSGSAFADTWVNRQKTVPGVASQWPWALGADGVWMLKRPDAADSTFTQTTPGAKTQTVHEKLSHYLDVTDYGADASAATDSCNAITKAVADLPAGLSGFGSTLYFPRGTYITSCFPTINDKAVAIVGAASNSTQLTFTSANVDAAGLRFEYSTPVAFLVPQVRNITLATVVNQTNGNACINIKRPAIALSVPSAGPFLSDVVCNGTGTTYWADGVRCSFCTFLSMQRVQIVGASVAGSTVGTNNISRGVFLDNSTDVNIYDSHFYFMNKGISLDRDSEGLKLDFSSFVMTDYGVYTETNWQGPSLVVAHSHFNVTTNAIHIEGGSSLGQTSQAQIHDNLIYRWLNSAVNPWNGIECVNGATFGSVTFACHDHNFHNNNIIGFRNVGAVITNCFRLGSYTEDVSIHDNTCRDADYFIDMGSSFLPSISIYNNHGVGTTNVAWQRNQNPLAIWRGNTPVSFGSTDLPIVMQALNATTWGFGGTTVTSYLTNSNTATTVADAIGGWPGLIVNIRCSDTNTSISNGAGATKFALNGGSAYTCPRVGASITFMFSDQWREISRSN